MSDQGNSLDARQEVFQQEQSLPRNSDRRSSGDRRINGERRFDPRGGTTGRKRSVKAWVRSLTNPRIGVDRRKGDDRRKSERDRTISVKSLLTQEELAELLK